MKFLAPLLGVLCAASAPTLGDPVALIDPDPVAHYRAQVIGGPGAFVEVASGFDDYPRAILKKLLREIDQPLILSSH